MSFPVWNSDPSWNKITSSYFRDNIDLSGNFIIRNGTIRSPNNTIEFDDTFGFINFDNASFFGQLKNTFNSVEYDVGLQCEKTDEAVADIATLSPIVSDTQFKLTGLYWDVGLSSTVFTNNVSFPNGSISSLAINNSSFVSLSGAQTIDGVKTFNSAPVMSGGSISVGSIPINRVSGTAVNTNGAQNITATKTFTVAQTFQNNIRLDGSLLVNNGTTTLTNAQLQAIPDIATLKTITTAINYTPATTTTVIGNVLQFTGTLNGWNTTNFSNAINYAKDLTSSAQSQINTITSNSVLLANNNIFTGNQTFNGTTTTVANTLATSNITFSGNLNTIPSATFAFINSLTSNAQTQLTALGTRATTLETKTTKMSYMSVGGINTTTILDGLISQTFSFTGTINNINTTVFGYLSGVSSSIQTQLNNLSARIATFEIVGTIIMSPLLDLETTTSNKYLMCNGQAVSRTTYSALFAKFGTLFGVGNGSTTFNIMNYNGMFLRGMGNQIINNVNYGNYNSTYAPDPDSIQNHTHSGQAGAYLGTVNTLQSIGYQATQNYAPNSYSFANTGQMATGRINDFETKPVSIGIYYYVRT